MNLYTSELEVMTQPRRSKEHALNLNLALGPISNAAYAYCSPVIEVGLEFPQDIPSLCHAMITLGRLRGSESLVCVFRERCRV